MCIFNKSRVDRYEEIDHAVPESFCPKESGVVGSDEKMLVYYNKTAHAVATITPAWAFSEDSDVCAHCGSTLHVTEYRTQDQYGGPRALAAQCHKCMRCEKCGLSTTNSYFASANRSFVHGLCMPPEVLEDPEKIDKDAYQLLKTFHTRKDVKICPVTDFSDTKLRCEKCLGSMDATSDTHVAVRDESYLSHLSCNVGFYIPRWIE